MAADKVARNAALVLTIYMEFRAYSKVLMPAEFVLMF